MLNEQTTYKTWEFIYDPRIEQLYAKASLFGGASTASSGWGRFRGRSSGYGGTSDYSRNVRDYVRVLASPTTPTTPSQQ